MTPWSSTLARRSLECAPMLLQPVLNNLTLITLTSFVGTLGPAALAGSGLAGVAAGGFLVLRHDAGARVPRWRLEETRHEGLRVTRSRHLALRRRRCMLRT
jgi:hypothetical protein